MGCYFFHETPRHHPILSICEHVMLGLVAQLVLALDHALLGDGLISGWGICLSSHPFGLTELLITHL